MKKLYFMAAVLIAASATAQTTVDFEDLTLSGVETTWNGDDLSGDFLSGTDFSFENAYDTAWNYWAAGFAYSNITTDTLVGVPGLLSSYAGGGVGGSGIYAIGQNNANLTITGAGFQPMSIMVTNNNYAAHSMLNGDSYGKVFGDSLNAAGVNDGTNGEDWFLLEVRGYDASGFVDSTLIYLADYRFADNTQDYILKDWTSFDLNLTPGAYTQLLFKLSSSDVGQWGMNTPAFFAIDNIVFNSVVGTEELTINTFNVYPNPTADLININTDESNASYVITNLQGQVVLSSSIIGSSTQVDVRNLSTGLYHISVITDAGIITKKFQKI